MVNLIQPITVQQAYEWVTHSRRWASWNCWWSMVDDDDGDESPSPERRTDSRSALPMKNRRWRRLCIVKRDETSSLIFFLGESEFIALKLGSVELRGPHKLHGRTLGGGGRTHVACGPLVGPHLWIFTPVFFIYSIKNLQKVLSNSENFYFCTKTTPWQFC